MTDESCRSGVTSYLDPSRRGCGLDEIRIPQDTVIMNSIIAQYHPKQVRLTLPMFLGKVPAGFPSPAMDYIQKRLSTDDLLIHDSEAT